MSEPITLSDGFWEFLKLFQEEIKKYEAYRPNQERMEETKMATDDMGDLPEKEQLITHKCGCRFFRVRYLEGTHQCGVCKMPLADSRNEGKNLADDPNPHVFDQCPKCRTWWYREKGKCNGCGTKLEKRGWLEPGEVDREDTKNEQPVEKAKPKGKPKKAYKEEQEMSKSLAGEVIGELGDAAMTSALVQSTDQGRQWVVEQLAKIEHPLAQIASAALNTEGGKTVVGLAMGVGLQCLPESVSGGDAAQLVAKKLRQAAIQSVTDKTFKVAAKPLLDMLQAPLALAAGKIAALPAAQAAAYQAAALSAPTPTPTPVQEVVDEVVTV